MLCRADISPKTVYITPLCRTRQTAEVLFPGARLVEIDDLKEMCFGSFEGRNYIEMEHDPDYLAWVAANCESPCPDGDYTLEPVFSAKTQREKLAQRQFFFWYKPEERRNIINELRRIGRKDLIDKLYGK